MPLLRPSAVGRLLPPLTQHSNRMALVSVRSKSDSPSISTQQRSLKIPDHSTDVVRHKIPEYGHPVDRATSSFSPVPRQVMDGSEEGDVLPAAVLSGAPIELQARTVRIYQPSKAATQSGEWHSHHWRMDWDILQNGHRWENPLMGWQSSGDFMQGTHLNFKSKEDAIHFAEKQGYEYFVQEPHERKFVPKAYANNFLYTAKKLKHIRTK
ncbi:MAG: hypothetical protein M1840_003158 [Geoglossum simile]|nr:MAG: hypothetical protein M1840_003158 [Geoglossum simile]